MRADWEIRCLTKNTCQDTSALMTSLSLDDLCVGELGVDALKEPPEGRSVCDVRAICFSSTTSEQATNTTTDVCDD